MAMPPAPISRSIRYRSDRAELRRSVVGMADKDALVGAAQPAKNMVALEQKHAFAFRSVSWRLTGTSFQVSVTVP